MSVEQPVNPPAALAIPDQAVEELYADYLGLVQDLGTTSPSGLAALNRSYHKHLLVAAASSLEDRVKKVVPEFFERLGTKGLGVFVSKAVMARGYHTLFDWNSLSASKFFQNFGDASGGNFKARLKSDDNLKRQHDSFMRLGALRNEVVHNDYASHAIQLTPAEVMSLYRDACIFVAQMELFALWSESQES